MCLHAVSGPFEAQLTSGGVADFRQAPTLPFVPVQNLGFIVFWKAEQPGETGGIASASIGTWYRRPRIKGMVHRILVEIYRDRLSGEQPGSRNWNRAAEPSRGGVIEGLYGRGRIIA